MRIRKLIAVAGGLAVVGSLCMAAAAQTGTATQPAKKPGLLGRLLPRRKHPVAKEQAAGSVKSAGQIIGNKNTKVYHLPGDKGSMPALQNRVYFKTEADAQAAGYRRARAAGPAHAKGKALVPRREIKREHGLKK